MPAGSDLAGLAPDESGNRPSGLAAAFLVAFALHVAALLAVAFLRLAPPAPPGEQQITVDLAPLMTEAQTESVEVRQASPETPPEQQPTEEPVEEATTPPPPPEVAEVKPEETPAEAPPQTQAMTEAPPDAPVAEPDSQVITSTAPEAEPLAPPPPTVAEAPKPVEPEKPVVPEKPKPDLAKLKAEREAKLKAQREARQREEKREEMLEKRREELREAKLKAAREARARESRAADGAERASAAASRQNAAGRAAAGSDPSAMRQWTGAISAAIHGRMNPGAATGTSGGTAVVRFTVMRSGAVSSAGLARSSGVGQIDSAALGAVRGSLPPAPAGVNQASLTVTIPLNYRVR